VLGVGYELIHGLLRGEILGAALLGLLVGKALVWAIALGSGTSGGVLAPLLIIGGAIGAFIGQWLPVGDTGLWTMIGMAAMMGGTMRSPLTGMFFLLELTHDLNALPALLCGTVAALGVTVLLLRRSILTEKLARRGQHIAREYSVDLFEMMRVSEVMDANVPLVPASTPLPRFSARIASGDPLISGRQGTLPAAKTATSSESSLAAISSGVSTGRATTRSPSAKRARPNSSSPIRTKPCTTPWRACCATTSAGCRSSSGPTKKEPLVIWAGPASSPRASVIITKKNSAPGVSTAMAKKADNEPRDRGRTP
jgi:hypothetical protein